MPRKAANNETKIKEAPIWMWSIAFFGLALAAGSIVFMIYEAAAGDSSPPNVAVHLDSISPSGNGFLVQFRAVNDGGTTAQGLTIQGELRNGTESMETSNTTIEHVPSHSEREGGLFFTADPRQFELRLRPKGYEKP
jgi:uncharacterized protein (TIGR02588 family)